MTNGFIEIKDTESLDNFLAQSNDAPKIIFKHSNSCGISSQAYTQLTRLGRTLGIVTVQEARGVSDEIEKRTGVGHETPQLFIFSKGKVRWTASHGQIKAEAVAAAFEEIRAADEPVMSGARP